MRRILTVCLFLSIIFACSVTYSADKVTKCFPKNMIIGNLVAQHFKKEFNFLTLDGDIVFGYIRNSDRSVVQFTVNKHGLVCSYVGGKHFSYIEERWL